MDFENEALELTSACQEPVGLATCPYSWNSCRRSGKCEMREDARKALRAAFDAGRTDVDNQLLKVVQEVCGQANMNCPGANKVRQAIARYLYQDATIRAEKSNG